MVTPAYTSNLPVETQLEAAARFWAAVGVCW